MLSWTFGCNVVTRATFRKQEFEPSNPPPPLVEGKSRSLAEQEEHASKIFEERRLSIQQEWQALDDSYDRFLVTLTTHPAMDNWPIMRNSSEVRDFFGRADVDEVWPLAINHHAISGYSATPLSGDRRNQVLALARSTTVAMLVEGLTDRRLDKAEVQSLQQYDRIPPRRVRRGWSSLRAKIADHQDPGRCPDFRAGGRVEHGEVYYQGEVPRFMALSYCEEQVDHNRPDPEVRPAIRQGILALLRDKAPQVVITHDNFAVMMEDHLRRRCRPLEVGHFSVGEPLTWRARIALLPATWVMPRFFRFDKRRDPDLHLIEFIMLMAPNNYED